MVAAEDGDDLGFIWIKKSFGGEVGEIAVAFFKFLLFGGVGFADFEGVLLGGDFIRGVCAAPDEGV